jgi:ZIP family zinc transporter
MATGILVFLFWDVMSNGVEPIEEAIRAHGFAHVSSYSALLLGGFGLGFMGLIGYERWMHGHRRRSLLGPGAASAVEFETVYPLGLTPPRFLALLIATGIGLHNFAEGLAIGQSAAGGQLQLAIALIVGFGLHNATEGFGIVAPLTGERRVPSWRFLLLLGLIGGGPTFVGTVVGQAWVSTSLSILFLGLAAGSILYVVMQLLTICRTFGHASLAAWGVTTGLVLGFATDFILVGLGV